MSKKLRLSELYDKYSARFKGKEIVLGDGNPDTKILLVGEAPGRDEVKLGKPFVGMAGKNLKEFLDIIDIERDSIYVTNAIKYRLSKVNPHTGGLVNRPAAREEIRENRDYLLEEILIIRPKYIVTLGNVPLRSVTGNDSINIGNVHGRVMAVQIKGEQFNIFPLYHPASIIYNRDLVAVYKSDIEVLGKLIKDEVCQEDIN